MSKPRPTGYLVRASGESCVYKDQSYQYKAGWRTDPPIAPKGVYLLKNRYNGVDTIAAAYGFRTQTAAHERAREVRRYFGAWAAPTYHLIPFWRQPSGERKMGEPVEIKL